MLSAIVDPSQWTGDLFMLPDKFTVDTFSRGEIYQTSGDSVGLEDTDLELLQIEEQILNGGSPLDEKSKKTPLSYGKEIESATKVPDELL